MSVVLILLAAAVVFVLLLGLVVVLIVAHRGRGETDPGRGGPVAGVLPLGPEPPAEADVLFVLRFPPAEAEAARALVERLAPSGSVDGAGLAAAARALRERLSAATHGHVGRAAGEPREASCPEPGGPVVALRSVTRTPLPLGDAPAAADLDRVLAALEALPEGDRRAGTLRLIAHGRGPAAPALEPLPRGG